MAADIIESFKRAGIAANDNDALAGNLAQEVITRVGNAIRASGADPAFEKEILDFLTEERRVCVVARRQCFGNGAQTCLLLDLLLFCSKRIRWKEDNNMAALDWSQCPAVESVPGRLSGAWVFKDTRMPVSTVFENLESGATIDEIMEWFDVTREQIVAVLEFAARNLDPRNPPAHESR